jgi:hypothetical protein
MEAIEPNLPGLVTFGITWLIACIGFFFVSGSLPLAAAPQAVKGGIGPALIWLNLICAIFLVIGSFIFAYFELRVTTLIVLGGLIFLFAPFVVQDLLRPIRDSKRGLILLLMMNAVAMYVLF